MSTLEQLRSGLGRAWDQVADGWRQLRERAGHALTHFNPIHRAGGDVESQDALIERSASRWSLLAADVLENADEVVVKLEVPGLDSENIDIQVVNDHLVIRGEKSVQRESREGRYHMLECAYGAFERAIPLPVSVDDSKASANYRNGILRVTLPKLVSRRTGRINVRVE